VSADETATRLKYTLGLDKNRLPDCVRRGSTGASVVIYHCTGMTANNIRIELKESDLCVPPVEVKLFKCKYYLLLILLFD